MKKKGNNKKNKRTRQADPHAQFRAKIFVGKSGYLDNNLGSFLWLF